MKKVILSVLIGATGCYSAWATNHDNFSIHVAKYKNDKACAISYTFDDGMKEHYTLVLRQLEKNHFKGTFWICGEFIENNSGAWLTWPQVKEMAEKGHEMSNHSWSHKNLKEISLEDVKKEIQKNDEILFKQTGYYPRTFCYPYNAFTEEIREIASANRVATRTKEYGIGTNSTPDGLDKWVADLLATNDWGVAMIHGITEGYDAFSSPAVLWDHFEKVKAQEDKIWVSTFREVAAYIREQEQVRLDITKTDKKVVIVPQLPLDKEIFNEPLTMVIENAGTIDIKIQQGTQQLPIKTENNKILFDFDPHGEDIVITYL